MNYTILEMLYNIPELQDLSYQLYLQMPDRISREARLAEVWQECQAVPDAYVQELFFKLEDVENCIGHLQEQAAFFAGMYLAWGLARSMGS